MNEFLLRIAECLDRGSVAETDVLVEFPEWDSLAVLSVIAMLDASYGVNVHAGELEQVRTVTDLWNLVQSRKA